MKKHYFLLTKKTKAKAVDTPVAQPEVWVSETHSYNTVLERVEVNWTLHCYPVQTVDLYVNIHHSSTDDGTSENWSWLIPKGQSSVSGLYPYVVGNMAVSTLSFGIYAGTGYSVPNTISRPQQVTVDVPAVVSDVPQLWVSETHSYDATNNRIVVEWRLNVDAALSEPLLVPIYHSSQNSGIREYWDWNLPAEVLFVAGTYYYPAGNLAGIEHLEFGIMQGPGFALPDTIERPKHIWVNVPDTLPDAPVTPSAPTNGVVDDTVDTFSFTRNTGYTTAEHEYSLNAGSTWTTCTNTIISVGNNAYAIGDIRVRVKALNGNPAGNQLFNAQRYSVKVVNGSNVLPTYNNPYPTSYDGPLLITQGGTYVSNWQSTDENVPSVKIRTSEPVILFNANTSSNGWGIDALMDSGQTLDLQVINCRHIAGARSNKQRRFIEASAVKRLYVMNCDLVGSAGIKVAGRYYGNGTDTETIKILYNKVLNIDGRTLSGSIHSQFFQCDGLRTDTVYRTDNAGQANELKYYQGIPHMEIGWNKIINEPNNCRVEDNINIFNSRGATNKPMYIHNNYVNGAYYENWQGNTYSGSGMIADSPGTHRGLCTAYVNFYRNTVIMSNGAPFGIAGGNNIKFIECVGIGKGVIDAEHATRLGVSGAGTELKGYPGTLYITDTRYNMNSTYDNEVIDYTDGIVGENSISLGYWRNDYSNPVNKLNPAYGTMIRLNILPNPIDRALENHYTQLWEQRVADNNITIGVVGPAN